MSDDQELNEDQDRETSLGHPAAGDALWLGRLRERKADVIRVARFSHR